jgi:hypothetical protein
MENKRIQERYIETYAINVPNLISPRFYTSKYFENQVRVLPQLGKNKRNYNQIGPFERDEMCQRSDILNLVVK